jgi:Flp pilus assembly pilin Flp
MGITDSYGYKRHQTFISVVLVATVITLAAALESPWVYIIGAILMVWEIGNTIDESALNIKENAVNLTKLESKIVELEERIDELERKS